VSSSPSPATADPPADLRLGLAARLGGEVVIGRIVDGLYDRLERDPDLKRLFGRKRPEERQRLTFFFTELFGGPARYREHALGDVGMQRRHEHKVIEVAEMERWLEAYAQSMADTGVADDMAADVLAVLRPAAERLVNGGAPHKEVRDTTVTAGKGDLAAVQAAIAAQPALLHQRGPDGVTPLWAAAAKGRNEVVSWLLGEGASPHARGSSAHATGVLVSPLAVAKGPAVADLLTGAGAELDLFDHCWLGHTDEVARLLDHDPDAVRSTCPEDDFFPITPLHHAVDADRLDTVDLLLRRGAAVEPYSRRLLAAAARQGSLPVVEALLAAGANAAEAEILGPIETDPLIAQLLVTHGLDVNHPPRNRETFLTMACRGDKGKRIGVVQALLDLGADPTVRDGFGTTAVEMAERSNFSEALERFRARPR
jgi:truncated hemoglobin YjbI/ankyrin repeat protein